MSQRRFSSIVITDEAGHPVGIVTERNILHAMRASSPPDTQLRTSMSAPVITVPGTMDCLEGYQICMREGIRHLVLTDEGGVVAGVVSETDFRLHLNLTVLAGRRQVISVAQRSVTSLPAHSSLMQALNLMQAQRESCVVVVEDERPIGIVTERDVVHFYSREPGRVSVHLAEVMTSPVLTIRSDATINEAAEQMLARKVRHLVLVDSSGRMVGLVSEHDLTQTMASGLMEEKFEVDELFLRTFIDTIPDLVWLKDADGVYLACNRHFESLYGASEKDIIGKTDYDFVPREQADTFRKHDLKAMAEDKSSANEEWLEFSDGYRGLFETIKTPMRDNQGQLIGVLGVARDITERKRTEQALQESESEFRTLAENLPDNIIRYDRDCRVRYMNPAMMRSIAPELLPVVGKLPYESDPDSEQIHGLQRLVEQVMGSGERVEVEFEIPHPDRTLHWHHVIFVPERDKNGKVIGALGIGRDISERVRTDEALKRSLAEYSGLVQRIPVGVYKYRMRADGGIAFEYVSPRWCELLDVSEDEVMRDPGAALAPIHADELERLARLNDEAHRNLRRFEWEGRVVRKNGEVRWLHIESQPTLMENGDILWDGIQYDVTDRRKVEETLRITASVFDNSQEAIVITDADNVIVNVNPAFTQITGYSRDEVLGRNPRLLSSGHQDKAFYAAMWASLKEERAWRGEIWNRRKSGEIYAELLSISVIIDDDGNVQRHVAVFSDITYFKEHEAELSYVANYDVLTGIPNRRLLFDRLGQAIAHAQRSGKMLAICYIDLDGFKDVNDQYGHETGDILLVDITRRLQEVLRAGDTLARLGGDEFVVLFNGLSQEIECIQVLERIVQTIATPIWIEDHQIAVSASVGVTFYPADAEDGDILLRYADQAMYVAKKAGKNRFHLYDAKL